MQKIFITILLLFWHISFFSQTNLFYIKPIDTDINYAELQDSHMVVINETTRIYKLVLFIGGTNSSTWSYHAFCTYAANLGYDVINISYPNSVAATSLGVSADSMSMNNFRQEVCFGTPVSDAVSIDTLNSIYTRSLKLIHYLHDTYPTHNWNQYLVNPTSLDWSKIVVAGHSQGGGHACYFAKMHEIDRVLMFAAPNDYSYYYSSPANWLRTSGHTSLNKHFAYLHLQDEVMPFHLQLENLKGLGLYPLYDSVHIDDSSSPFENSRIIYTTQEPGIALTYHNTPIKNSTINNEVWLYMLTSESSMNIENHSINNSIVIYPNPTSEVMNISSEISLTGKSYKLYSISGQLITTGEFENTRLYQLNIANLPQGIYYLNIQENTFTIFKH